MVITGGILGIVAMRLVVGQLLVLVKRYPALVDGAFVIIAWVGFKLSGSISTPRATSHFEIPQWFSLGLIVVIFAAAYAYARAQGPVETSAAGEDAEHMLGRGRPRAIAARDGTVDEVGLAETRSATRQRRARPVVSVVSAPLAVPRM